MAIDATTGFVWIGEATSGEEGVEQTLRLRPDLVLLDVRMPGIGGIEAASRIASFPQPPVVVLVTETTSPDAIPAGAAAELLVKHRLKRAALQRLWEDHSSDEAL